jgi:hypothetical protein
MAKAKRTRQRKASAEGATKLYEFGVYLLDGLLTEAFAKENPQVLRIIQIRGDQTLEELHEAIFKAHNRYDGHMYEFQIGGKIVHDQKARRYVLPRAYEADIFGKSPAGDVTQTRIDSLGLKPKDIFVYWFDFGDDWIHSIELVRIHDTVPSAKFPRVIKRIGKSPPQYPDFEEEEEEDDEDDKE